MTDCGGLIGLTEPQLQAHLGRPSSSRNIDGDVWLVFRSPDVTVRVRCRDKGDGSRCAAWTASFPDGFETLAEATSAVGLWPAAQPDEAACTATTPMVRRPLSCPEQSLVFSLTATIRDGRFTRISVFDEAPDWR